MKRKYGTITQRGQVTVPAEVRRRLGVGPKDRLAFVIEDDTLIRLEKAEFTLESAFGSVEPRRKPEDIDEAIRIAKDEKSERTGRELDDE